MHIFHDLHLRQKLLLFFGLVLLFLTVASALLIWQFQTSRNRDNQLQQTYYNLAISHELLTQLAEMQSNGNSYLLSGDASFLVNYEQAKQQYTTLYGRLIVQLSNESAQYERLHQIDQQVRTWDETVLASEIRLRQDVDGGKQPEATILSGLTLQTSESQLHKIREDLNIFQALMAEAIRQETGAQSQEIFRAQVQIMVLAFIIILGILVFFIGIFRQSISRLTRLLHLVAEAPTGVSPQQLSALPAGSDEIGRLTKAFTNLLEAVHQMQQRHETAVAALHQSQKRFETIFQANPAAISLSTLSEGRFIEVNDAALRTFQHTREEVIGKTAKDIQIFRDPEERAAFIAQLLTGTSRRIFELQLQTGTGNLIDVLVVGELIEIDGIACVMLMSTDITERRRIERNLRESEERFRQMVEHISNVFWISEPDGTLIYLSPGFEAIWERPVDTMYGPPDLFLETVHTDDRARYMAIQAMYSREASSLEYRIQRPDSTMRWINSRAYPVRDADGNVQRIVGSFEDITHRKESESVILKITSQLDDQVYELTLLNELTDLLQVCPTAENAYEIISHFMGDLFPSEFGALWMINEGQEELEAVATWRHLNGDLVCESNACWALRRGRIHVVDDAHSAVCCDHARSGHPGSTICIPMMARGEVIGLFYLAHHQPRGLTEEHQRLAQLVARQLELLLANLRLQETLRLQVIRDPLTGLFNRRYLEATMVRELHRAKRQQIPLGVMMLDIDHFKRFNDTYGHPAGDALLRAIGSSLQSHLRTDDVACRYGGEEFTLLLPGVTLEILQMRANDLLEIIRTLRVHHHHQEFEGITASIGIAVFPQHGLDSDQLLSAADAALYAAKQRGRDQVVAALSNLAETVY